MLVNQVCYNPNDMKIRKKGTFYNQGGSILHLHFLCRRLGSTLLLAKEAHRHAVRLSKCSLVADQNECLVEMLRLPKLPMLIQLQLRRNPRLD